MKLNRRAVSFGVSETNRLSRRVAPAHLAAVSAIFGLTAFTGSERRSTANLASDARTSERYARRNRRRWSVVAIAVLALLLPLAAIAGSTQYVWPGGTTILVRDYTSDAFAGIVADEVASWSAVMPGGTRLQYDDAGFKDCNMIGSMQTNSVPLNEIWICSTAKVGDRGTWGYGYAYTQNNLIVRGYVKIEEDGPKTQFERYGTVCHELGHTLGLRHMRGGETCMSARRVRRELPGKKDATTLANRYAAAGSP